GHPWQNAGHWQRSRVLYPTPGPPVGRIAGVDGGDGHRGGRVRRRCADPTGMAQCGEAGPVAFRASQGTVVMTRLLPPGAWQTLFPRALMLLGEVRTHGGIKEPFWTMGGGTVLMY